jgi:hypothetical protein
MSKREHERCLQGKLRPPLTETGPERSLICMGMEFPFNRPMRADDSYRELGGRGTTPGRCMAAIFMSALAKYRSQA